MSSFSARTEAVIRVGSESIDYESASVATLEFRNIRRALETAVSTGTVRQFAINGGEDTFLLLLSAGVPVSLHVRGRVPDVEPSESAVTD